MMERDRDRDRDRKPGGKRGKNPYYDRRRKPEEEWPKNPSSSYTTKPKKKYGGRYDNRDYEYQYIHKDRRQYSREELLKLAPKAFVKRDILDQLTIKYDLVFSDELKKPVGDIEDSKEDRFVETMNEGDRDDHRRDDPEGERMYQKKKEFVRFEELDDDSADYDKVDSYLEKKYKQHHEEDENMPSWATEDYDGEVPAWGAVDSKEVLKQSENGDWGSSHLKTLNKKEIKDNMEDRESYSSEEEREKRQAEEEHDYYAYDSKKHKYHFFDEYEEEEELGKEDKEKERSFEEGRKQPGNAPPGRGQGRRQSDNSSDSGMIPADKVQDINSVFMKMKKDEENERENYAPEIISANFYEEELRERRMEIEMNQKKNQNNQPVETPTNRSIAGTTPSDSQKVSLVDDLFGGINAAVQKKYPGPNQPSHFAVNNLSFLGAFTSGSNPIASLHTPVSHLQSQQVSSLSPQLKSTGSPGPQVHLPQQQAAPNLVYQSSQNQIAKEKIEEGIDIIVGPPPSVAKQDEEIDEVKEKSKKEFQEKYIPMERALCQVVYEILNSRRRQAIDMHSTNGINQIAVEKYCANNYKIFSFLMQGDIFSRVWKYKDKVGNIQGPYMSFDMDIWNGEGKYFSRSLAISPNKKDYFPLSMYVDRDEKVLELMQEVNENLEKSLDQQPSLIAMPPYPPNWLPPQIASGQFPMMSFHHGRGGHGGLPHQNQPHSNNKRRGGGQTEFVSRGGRGGGAGFTQSSPYQQALPQGNSKKAENPNVVNLLSIGGQQGGYVSTGGNPELPEMTSSLKEMLGLPNDPAISNATVNHNAQDKLFQSTNNQGGNSKYGLKNQAKANDDDFPTLSTLRK